MSIKLVPWRVPNFVSPIGVTEERDDGELRVPSWHISCISPDVLSQQCDDFRKEAFRKAKLKDPRERK